MKVFPHLFHPANNHVDGSNRINTVAVDFVSLLRNLETKISTIFAIAKNKTIVISAFGYGGVTLKRFRNFCIDDILLFFQQNGK